jgi:hypothetical protein
MKQGNSARKLQINREVVRQLDDKDLKDAAAGIGPVTGLCMYSLYVQCITGTCP